MKLTDKQRRLIVLGIGLIIIILGLAQAALKINIDSKTMNNVTFVLMIVAVALLFSGRKNKKDAEKEPEAKPERNNIAETKWFQQQNTLTEETNKVEETGEVKEKDGENEK